MVFLGYIDLLHQVLSNVDCEEQGFPIAINHIRSAKKVIIIGNGGSAAIASHMQNDLCKACGIRAMVLTEAPLLTALSNDDHYMKVYAKLTDLWIDKGDLLIAISSSGESHNIIGAAITARLNNANVITLSGFKMDNPLRRKGAVNFYIPSMDYGVVELSHSIITHYLTDMIQNG
jgi:D-sedoheptulose 7-phosphate isomerase